MNPVVKCILFHCFVISGICSQPTLQDSNFSSNISKLYDELNRVKTLIHIQNLTFFLDELDDEDSSLKATSPEEFERQMYQDLKRSRRHYDEVGFRLF